MATCPKCGAVLKDEYGMSMCGTCRTISFIDMDGNAFVQTDAETEPESAAAPALDADEARSDEFTGDENPFAASSGAIEGFESNADFPPLEPVSHEATPDLGPAGDPLGLGEFANSEISSAKDGPLLFRVLISGIDSKEIREIIREVLEDARFGWDAAEVMSRLNKGALSIDGLAPVKASILVTRIKRLPVKIKWEQYAISQSGSP